jgi:diphosphomevalonate decarboxylase
VSTSTNSYSIPKVTWAAPSNIALVKYWGKKGFQLPANASLSLTLSKAYTQTTVSWERNKNKGLDFEFFFEGKENLKFFEKMKTVLLNLSKELPFLVDYKLKIETVNTFPHSTGIASSASSMAALALCLCSMEKEILGQEEDFFKRASYLARMGSGSASRSIFGEFVQWGELRAEGSDLYATKVKSYHQNFSQLRDTILIVSSEEKKLSSTMGHKLMDDSPAAIERYSQANKNVLKMLEVLSRGNLSEFGAILEEEAFALHANILNSSKGEVILLTPNSLEVIERVRKFRKERNLDLYFTMDAGPNIHLLYPKNQEVEINSFIEMELLKFCESYILDEMGSGPWKIS